MSLQLGGGVAWLLIVMDLSSPPWGRDQDWGWVGDLFVLAPRSGLLRPHPRIDAGNQPPLLN